MVITLAPFPSHSTSVTRATNASRPRRHTINRPDSALALLSDLSADEGEEDDDNDEEDGDGEIPQERFDRISDILSSLIQEANNAVNNNIEHEVENKKLVLKGTTLKSSSPQQQPPPSRLPRLRKSRASYTPGIVHARDSSTSSISSLFSSTSSSTTSSSSSFIYTPSCSKPSSPTFKKPIASSPIRRRSSKTPSIRPQSCPTLPRSHHHAKRHSMSLHHQQQEQGEQKQLYLPAKASVLQEPLMESFKRLDSSLALVDSLSRDLASSQEEKEKRPLDRQSNNNHSRFSTLFFLLPLLHIPHALMTMILDPPRHTSSSGLISTSSPLTGVFTWAFFFLLANLMVDHVVIPVNPLAWLSGKTGRLSLPGAFKAEGGGGSQRKRPSPNEHLEDVPAMKRTRAFLLDAQYYQQQQQQQQQRPRLMRRNSF
ncbi:hypothetical protein EC973_002554 [Apophysomyces ossiformis]|uniref:Uncharacterized protein n=1 Tax=Apophysomyces ossiformis TaxID=679940 RepID=A0A8H7BXP5_9FUNG|nr:hypothetical protein EC973_002554 [Apophysomyces ossiformis]